MSKLLLPLAAAILCAATAGAQQAHPIRLIAAPDATSQPVFGFAAAVRQLPDGRVLVNDIAKRQLVLLDAALHGASVGADSASGGANSYGPRPGALVAYAADSSLFIDPAD